MSIAQRSLSVHPLAALMPEMTPEELEALRADVAEHGVNDPITVYEGQILDGRHRYQVSDGACMTVEFTGTPAEAAAFVLSHNVHRRHLAADQRVATFRRFEEYTRKQRGEKRPAKAKGGRPSMNGTVQHRTVSPVKEAARAASVSSGTVSLVDQAVDLAVEAGIVADHESGYAAIQDGTAKPSAIKKQAEELLNKPLAEIRQRVASQTGYAYQKPFGDAVAKLLNLAHPDVRAALLEAMAATPPERRDSLLTSLGYVEAMLADVRSALEHRPTLKEAAQ